jgi:hypothetical protein
MFPAKIQLIDETGDQYALNCRKVNGLLSAYMDAELSDAEMPIIQDHLESCPKCRQEYDTLRETKRMVASLAVRAPRTDLEDLLRTGLERSAPPSLTERFSYWWEENIASEERLRVRPHILAATTLFSIAGLWMATATLDGSHDWQRRLPITDYRVSPSITVIGIEFTSGHVRLFAGQKAGKTIMAPLEVFYSRVEANGEATGFHPGTPRAFSSAGFGSYGTSLTPASFGSIGSGSLISTQRMTEPGLR